MERESMSLEQMMQKWGIRVFRRETRPEAGETDGKVNINQASKEELMTLPGIGEVKADAIIQYRTEQGKFASIEEIKNISGIKDGVFEKMKDKITV